jgi:chorismate mutase
MIAIRGATTIEENKKEEIEAASIELFSKLLENNNLDINEITAIFFSCTKDITKDYPGKFIREYFKLGTTAIMHFNEMDVENSLEKCIRILIFVDRSKNENINYIYLKKAKYLRRDLLK